MKKETLIIGAIFILFLAAFMLQPATAATTTKKLIDKSHTSFYSPMHGSKVLIEWKSHYYTTRNNKGKVIQDVIKVDTTWYQPNKKGHFVKSYKKLYFFKWMDYPPYSLYDPGGRRVYLIGEWEIPGVDSDREYYSDVTHQSTLYKFYVNMARKTLIRHGIPFIM